MPKYPLEYLKIFNEQCVKPLSDPTYQERIWLKRAGPEVDSINEGIMSFFERCIAFIDPANEQEGLTIEHIEMLKILYGKIDEYCLSSLGEPDEEEIKRVLSDPKWREIQNYSKKIYNEIKKTYDHN
jgi:hypothetical protein